MRSRIVQVEQNAVHVADTGGQAIAGAGHPTLVFLSAAPLWSFTWRHVIGALAPTFRCVAIDYAGFGPSPRPPRALTLPQHAACVAATVRALDLHHVVLVMNDVGGAIGMAAAASDPDRYRGFVPIDALGFSLSRFGYIRAMLGLMNLPGARLVHRWTNGLRTALAWLGLPWRLPRAERRELLSGMDAPAGRDQAFDLLRALGRESGFLRELEAGLAPLSDRPVLTVFGAWDPARLAGFPRRWAELFPHTTQRVVPGGGHFSHEDHPAFVAAAIREAVCAWATTRGHA